MPGLVQSGPSQQKKKRAGTQLGCLKMGIPPLRTAYNPEMAIYYLDVNLILYGTLRSLCANKCSHCNPSKCPCCLQINPWYNDKSSTGRWVQPAEEYARPCRLIIPCRWSNIQKTLNWKHQSSSSSFGSIIRHIPLYPHLSCLNPILCLFFLIPWVRHQCKVPGPQLVEVLTLKHSVCGGDSYGKSHVLQAKLI